MNLISRQGIRLILKSAKIVWESSPKWSIINIFLVFIRGLIPLVLLYLIKLLIDEVSNTILLPVENRTYTGALIVVGYAGLLFLMNSLSATLSTLAREKQSYQVNDYIQGLIYDKTTKIQYSFFENPDYQDVYFRAISDANYRPTRIFYGLVGLIQNFITIILLGGVLLTINWWMSVILIFAVIPTAIQRMLYARKSFLLHRSQTEDERRLSYYNRLLTYRDYAKELRIFDLGNLFNIRLITFRNLLRKEQLKLLIRKTRGEIITLSFTTIVIIGFYSLITINTIKGIISGGAMVMYFLALQRGYGYFQELLSKLSSLFEDSLFIRNFVEFLNIELQLDDIKRDRLFPKKISECIEFRNIKFKYEHSRNWVLNDVSFKINPGETIALVGINGSGKTTLIKILSGLYEPDEGQILIDNVELKEIDRSSLADNISVIFQDFMLYNVPARENIWFGNVKDKINEDGIVKAAQDAGVHQLFSNLPKGYDTLLGNLFKDSEQLSQGEWQRVALARSFYNNAQVIILDEPTSSLDAFNEAKLISHFKEITKGKTSIIISHRLSTISLADRIVVLKDSKLEEIGTYDELISKKGVFFEMSQVLKNTLY